ncbi:hypothetical protein ACFQAT_27985 [Undibacterium arcticum]|uniref:Uncharacterized protein n=1 Tax=Undibacterium arcticum TaxID=1762892 RepID=A0ABV7F322_9BURK
MQVTQNPIAIEFLARLNHATAVSIDFGPMLPHSWTLSDWTGEPFNEVVRIAWRGDDHEFSMTFTETAIERGRFDNDGRFFVYDSEGDLATINFYQAFSIVSSADTLN